MSISVALIGCGKISNRHLDSICAIDGLELICVCDNDKDALEKVPHKVSKVDTYRHVADLRPELVSICTPNYLHFEMARFFLMRGSNVLLEKPITIKVEHARELVALAKERDKHLFAVKQVRFNPAVRALKSAVSQGKLGKLISCNLTMHWNRPQEYFDTDSWRGKKELDGGTFINQGIHYLDLLVWILGSVTSVTARTETLNHDIEVEDHVSAILCFENGAVGTVDFNVNAYSRNIECSIVVQGSKGYVKIGGNAVNKIEVWDVKNTPRPSISEGLVPNIYEDGLYQGSCPNHIFVYQNVRDVLLGRERKVATDGESALRTLKVVQAIYKSSELDATSEVFL